MKQIENIKQEVTLLSPEERAQLAHWLIVNLEEEREIGNENDIAWRSEIRNRVEEIRLGKVKMIPASEMWNDIFGDYVKKS